MNYLLHQYTHKAQCTTLASTQCYWPRARKNQYLKLHLLYPWKQYICWEIYFVSCGYYASVIWSFVNDHLFLQSYNRDLFLFLYFLLIIVSAMTSFKIHHDKSPLSGKSILYLNRHQTEEWKGWMQVGHFFAWYYWSTLFSYYLQWKTFCVISELCKVRHPWN